MSINFTAEQVVELAREHKVVPVIETLFSGSETPLSIFERLAADKPGSFLLESAEQGVWSRYSFIGVTNRGFLSLNRHGLNWTSSNNESPLPDDAELATEPLMALSQIERAWNGPEIENLPPLTSGLVGLVGWDMIREIENLPNKPAADFEAPILAMAMFRDAVVLDHKTSNLLLISNIFVSQGIDINLEYAHALARLAVIKDDLKKPVASSLSEVSPDSAVLQTVSSASHRVTEKAFLDSIERAKHYVRIGDVFQVVIAQRFDHECRASALDVYRVLRTLNPSPYMYLLNFEDEDGPYALVGSSPEALVKVQAGHAVTHPIAGSRPRGETSEADLDFEVSLIADPKEKAEHLMLVDLARNDLLKVCEPSSVAVTEFMQVHRYSHIMHLVSTVEGDVRAAQSPVDVFKATFPAGTLSGAPKPRALEIIDELEPSNRGIYGGVVGYFDFAGNADLAIAIRTAFIRDQMAYVEAGAGIVLDSVPLSEYQETVNKAGAPLRAVVIANEMHKL